MSSAAMSDQNIVKCVVVGDGMVGKTCMLITYVNKDFPTTYVPTVFENHAVNIQSGKKEYNLNLYDTAGQEDFDRLRLLLYPETNCFIICFSLVYPTSLANVETSWIPEIKSKCPDVPIILVGTKNDSRSDPKTLEELTKKGESPITFEQGKGMAKKIGAVVYMECSALKNEGLNDIFEKAVELGKQGNEKQSKKKGFFKKLF